MEEIHFEQFSDSENELQNIDNDELLNKLLNEYNINDNNINDNNINDILNEKDDKDIVKFSCGGPNIKIKPLFGDIYYLSSDCGTFMLLDNNNKKNRLSIKAECWNLSEDLIETSLDKYIKNNSNKVDRYKKVLSSSLYMRYIQINYNNNSVVVDLKDMGFKEYTNSYDLKNYDLPSTDLLEEYQNFEVSKKSSSKNGLIIGGEKTPAIKIVERNIKINTNEGEIEIRLARDRKHIINRNSIDITASSNINWYNYSGLLIRENEIFLEPNNINF